MVNDVERTAATLAKEARLNTRWRRTECINLTAIIHERRMI
jgi:hypothetical protein